MKRQREEGGQQEAVAAAGAKEEEVEGEGGEGGGGGEKEEEKKKSEQRAEPWQGFNGGRLESGELVRIDPRAIERSARADETAKAQLSVVTRHWSDGDGRGGFRAALVDALEHAEAEHDSGKADDERYHGAYVSYIITDTSGVATHHSLVEPPTGASLSSHRDDDDDDDDDADADADADDKETTTCNPPASHPVTTLAPADRRSSKGTMVLGHTYTPHRLRGRGIAERLCVEAFKWAAANQLRVDPECTYVSDTFLARRPEFVPFVVPGFRDEPKPKRKPKPKPAKPAKT